MSGIGRDGRAMVRAVADCLRTRYGRPAVRRQPPLEALIGTVLSQHTTDRAAHRALQELRRRFPRWEDLQAARSSAVAAAIRQSGLAHVKAVRIRGILRALTERFGRPTLAPLRRMPMRRAMTTLAELPGVGPKTAACVLLFGFKRDVCPVDTHVFRIAQRLGWAARSASPPKVQEWIAAHAPRGRRTELHLNLIRHGRQVCRAIRPRCGECVLAGICPSAVVSPHVHAAAVSRHSQPSRGR